MVLSFSVMFLLQQDGTFSCTSLFLNDICDELIDNSVLELFMEYIVTKNKINNK